jgi:hypothetical protein
MPLRFPNLFIIGAMKSGTSSLHADLGSHPQIFMSTPKEPMFFSSGADWRARLEGYLELFAAAGAVHYAGESSTEYSKAPRFPGVPERLHAFNPEARILYLMRDPIERAISHYWHMVRHHGERRRLPDALRREPEYADLSRYAMQLEPYVRLFGMGNVYALTFEEMVREPRSEWTRGSCPPTSVRRATGRRGSWCRSDGRACSLMSVGTRFGSE